MPPSSPSSPVVTATSPTCLLLPIPPFPSLSRTAVTASRPCSPRPAASRSSTPARRTHRARGHHGPDRARSTAHTPAHRDPSPRLRRLNHVATPTTRPALHRSPALRLAAAAAASACVLLPPPARTPTPHAHACDARRSPVCRGRLCSPAPSPASPHASAAPTPPSSAMALLPSPRGLPLLPLEARERELAPGGLRDSSRRP
nr:proline-rich receptor-like protein kinase PERK2 [Aegilops tauschii subsp. strangulata]